MIFWGWHRTGQPGGGPHPVAIVDWKVNRVAGVDETEDCLRLELFSGNANEPRLVLALSREEAALLSEQLGREGGER